MTDMGNGRLRELSVEFRDRFAEPALAGAVPSRKGALDVDVVGTAVVVAPIRSLRTCPGHCESTR